MKVLVFGAGGQLGRVLRMTTPYSDAVFLDRSGADLRDAGAIERALTGTRPELVINAAAYTAVDRAESEALEAYTVNEAAPATMAACCARLDARLIHLSTDYVFGGNARRPYLPGDATEPRNVYGASKLAGEQRVRETPGLRHLIIRTSWVYAEIGRNFLLTLLELARRQDRLRVVADQVGSPTSAWSLADAIWRAARLPACVGTAHFTDGGIASRHEFALGIFAAAARRGLPAGRVSVDPITSAEYSRVNPAAAARPAYSALDAAEFRNKLGFEAPDWQAALLQVVDRYADAHHG